MKTETNIPYKYYLEESELATDVVIMNHGRIIARGTPNELKNKYSHDYLIVYRNRNEDFEKKISLEGNPFEYDSEKSIYSIEVEDTKEAKRLLEKYDQDMPDVEIRKGTMDDVFLNVTGGKEDTDNAK